ncbi:MAG: AmmeMemoRadiSam system protein B, partial [Patescibacteria group bacterium]
MSIRRAMVLLIGFGVIAGVLLLVVFLPNRSPIIKTNADFFLEDIFFFGDRTADALREDGRIIAALVPHHLIAGTELATIFKLLQSKEYTRVFLIGPNHYDAGQANILTATLHVETPFGRETMNRWIPYPEIAPELLAHEHSIMGMMPYVSYYLNADTQPFILKAKTSPQEIGALAESIAAVMDEKTILIFSIDFSHYLPKDVAEKNDRVTAQALLAMDEDLVYDMSNDYVDSPPSLALMFQICLQQHARFK